MYGLFSATMVPVVLHGVIHSSVVHTVLVSSCTTLDCSALCCLWLPYRPPCFRRMTIHLTALYTHENRLSEARKKSDPEDSCTAVGQRLKLRE